MPRPRTPIGTFGAITFHRPSHDTVRARTRYRDEDGKLRRIEATGDTRAAAERNLKARLSSRRRRNQGGELTAETPFPKLVEVWLEDLELENRIAQNTRDLYERNMRTLVLPAFENYTLREVSVSKVDRFLKAQAARSHSRAKQAKNVLSQALGLAVRYEAIDRNPVQNAARLRKPATKTVALTPEKVHAIRAAVRGWRKDAGLCGPKPDGQLEAIIDVMLGTSARIGEVLAIRKCDVDVTSNPATVRIAGTIVSPKSKATSRQDHPKTSRSRRRVAVPRFTAEAIRQRLVFVADEDGQALLFHSRNHTPLTTANVRRRLRAIMDEAGIDGVTPHAFRRTVATALNKASGADLAAETLGHSSPDITRAHYIETDEQVDPVTADILEQFASEPATPPEGW